MDDGTTISCSNEGRRHYGGLSLTGIYNKNSFCITQCVFYTSNNTV